jgi:hypothetical protein
MREDTYMMCHEIRQVSVAQMDITINIKIKTVVAAQRQNNSFRCNKTKDIYQCYQICTVGSN